jgi:hypothetical protein
MAVDINGDGLIGLGGTSTTQGRLRLYEDTDNGTNYVEITAPASLTADRTLTLPDETGTIITTAGVPASSLPAGSVLQVVSATTTGTVTTTSTSFVETGLEVSITPSSASNKILVMASYMLNYIGTGNWVYSTLYRGATNLGTTEGFNGIYQAITGGITQDMHVPASIVYLDSPSTTSSTLYEVYIKVSNASNTGKFNQPQMRASIVAMEIAA